MKKENVKGFLRLHLLNNVRKLNYICKMFPLTFTNFLLFRLIMNPILYNYDYVVTKYNFPYVAISIFVLLKVKKIAQLFFLLVIFLYYIIIINYYCIFVPTLQYYYCITPTLTVLLLVTTYLMLKKERIFRVVK